MLGVSLTQTSSYSVRSQHVWRHTCFEWSQLNIGWKDCYYKERWFIIISQMGITHAHMLEQSLLEGIYYVAIVCPKMMEVIVWKMIESLREKFKAPLLSSLWPITVWRRRVCQIVGFVKLRDMLDPIPRLRPHQGVDWREFQKLWETLIWHILVAS